MSELSTNKTHNVTRMMRQYLELKEKYSDCILFFRLGDFYEMFFDDAITASKELEIVLTGKDCGLEDRAPMCGVPYHSVDSYINKLLGKGYKVAICEQLSDPKDANGSLVDRDVVRVITSGTVIEESMLDETRNNYIASIYFDEKNIGLAYSDVSTGEFRLFEIKNEKHGADIIDELERLRPTEIIANDALFLQEILTRRLKNEYNMHPYGGWAYEFKKADERLCRHFGVTSLTCFGCNDKVYAVSAAGALLSYLEETQKNALSHIKRLSLVNRSEFMCMDVATRRNLELSDTIRFDANKKNTLLRTIDKTVTAMGGRLLRVWVGQPLRNADKIRRRLDAVEELYHDVIALNTLRDKLSNIYDIERLCSRIAYGTVNARDCEALRVSLEQLPELIAVIKKFNTGYLSQLAGEIDAMEDIHDLLQAAIMPSPPVGVKDGGIIRDGYNQEVDELRAARSDGEKWIAQLEADAREKTGIKTLKVGYNRVFGYFIDVSRSQQHLVPYDYERKQTLANSERYITPELKELESKILGAGERCVELEYKLFLEIRNVLSDCIERLQKNSAAISQLDVLQAFASVARSNDYVKPEISEDSTLDIRDGRHPVVERTLKDSFIPNSAYLDNDENRLLILTGPNMAGKSTYMRQVALITLMAHIGCFVPASSAKIPVVDRIFTRVGASDNLASGQSTFMVEMSEMAGILYNATKDSLVILDEIGRGTSTFDGLSIAWAVLEHIADLKKCGAKTLFATHYHELTELEGKLDGVKNYRISVKEIGDDIIFLRRIVRGGADKSFGIQVARLAGLPQVVIVRAKEILQGLESADINHSKIARSVIEQYQMMSEQLSMLEEPHAGTNVVDELLRIDIDSLTPIEALNKLQLLQTLARGK